MPCHFPKNTFKTKLVEDPCSRLWIIRYFWSVMYKRLETPALYEASCQITLDDQLHRFLFFFTSSDIRVCFMHLHMSKNATYFLYIQKWQGLQKIILSTGTPYNQNGFEVFKTVEKIVPGNHNLHKAGLKKHQFPVADHIMLSDVNT